MTNSKEKGRDKLYLGLELVLNEHLKVHNCLLDLAKRETESILSRDEAKLPMLLKEQEKSLNEAGTLEEKRIALVNQIATEAGIAEDVTLRELLAYMPGDEAIRFRTSLVELSRLIGELAIVNNTNSRLLTQASAYAEMLLAAASGSEPSAIAYGPGGNKSVNLARRSIVDRQA